MIKPFSATVVESEGNGAQLPPNLAFCLHRGPGLNSGLRLDLFINKSSDEAAITIAIVNENNKPISLPRYELIGTLEICRVEKENIKTCAKRELSSSGVTFDANLPLNIEESDKIQLTNFLTDRKSIFASSTKELGKTGLVKLAIPLESIRGISRNLS
jgi:hypothetical protein